MDTTPKKASLKREGDDNATPRKRKAPATPVANSRAIARTLEECSEADQMLLKRRDAGAGWSEIRAEWEKITGDTVGKSTLPNRYNRLKANVSVISEEDCARLLAAKIAVEKKFETEKWTLIATAIQQQGGGEYTGAALKTQHKKLMAEGVTGPSQGMVKGEVEEAEEDEF